MLKKLNDNIVELVQSLKTVSAIKVFEDNVITCEQAGISDPKTLYNALKIISPEGIDYPEYPRICYAAKYNPNEDDIVESWPLITLGHNPLPIEIICYHCQQSAEKAIKAVLVSHDANYHVLLECRSSLKDWHFVQWSCRIWGTYFGQLVGAFDQWIWQRVEP